MVVSASSFVMACVLFLLFVVGGRTHLVQRECHRARPKRSRTCASRAARTRYPRDPFAYHAICVAKNQGASAHMQRRRRISKYDRTRRPDRLVFRHEETDRACSCTLVLWKRRPR